MQRGVLLNRDMVIASLTCAKCGKLSRPFPCEHCGSTEFLKQQTRRLVRPSKLRGGWMFEGKLGTIKSNHPKKGKFGAFIRNLDVPSFPQTDLIASPLGTAGDRLWVRETARRVHFTGNMSKFQYEVDKLLTDWIAIPKRIKPIKLNHCCSNGAFKELASIWFKITGVRAERQQDITMDDIKKEGLVIHDEEYMGKFPDMIQEGKLLAKKWVKLINSCYPGSCFRNEWVFVYELARCAKQIIDHRL